MKTTEFGGQLGLNLLLRTSPDTTYSKSMQSQQILSPSILRACGSSLARSRATSLSSNPITPADHGVDEATIARTAEGRMCTSHICPTMVPESTSACRRWEAPETPQTTATQSPSRPSDASSRDVSVLLAPCCCVDHVLDNPLCSIVRRIGSRSMIARWTRTNGSGLGKESGELDTAVRSEGDNEAEGQT